ncbi:MAG: 3-hydroxybutyryl-CoA dehydrogenase, partial [Deltaproteobacteria bacterium]|nr:3-hydroxybutyryl-CoA dehydrogenase [Deltaproteobacteria bacterium]
MSVQKIGVIGVGQMGAGIVQIAALAGFEVLACDQSAGHNEKASAGIKKQIAKLVEKGKLDAAAQAAAEAKIKWTTNLSDFKEIDLIIEAITENIPAKEKLFKELDQICSAKTILATNTSS